MKEQILDRLSHCIEETKSLIQALEAQYKTLGYGTMAFDITLKIERAKGELRALEDTRLYIKHSVSEDK